MIINGLEFRQTCSACPEQYDVYRGDVQVGYVRLRHGSLRADVPRCGGQTVYSTIDVDGDGCFNSYDEMLRHLTAIAEIINEEGEGDLLLRECLTKLDPDLELCDRIRDYLAT